MVPPAPPTFSTTIGWPSDARMPSATMRAMMSVIPPGGNGTIMVTGRDGKACAAALAMPAMPARHASTKPRANLRIRASPLRAEEPARPMFAFL